MDKRMQTSLAKFVRKLNRSFANALLALNLLEKRSLITSCYGPYSEVFSCSRVDENPKVPGKVVPMGGWPIAALEHGELLRVHSANKHIREIGDTTP
jgi:hypothetical protein